MTFPTALPQARTPGAMDAPILRWGIMGPGWIAERFVNALLHGTRQKVVAVASRSAERSADFASRWRIPRAYDTYAALADDNEVDVVYVATIHNAHYPCAMLAIQAGKSAVVEKPLALNAAQVAQLTIAAQRSGVFCMEALWTVFIPRFDVLRQVLADGLLGEIRSVLADLGQHFGPDHRIMRADLAGGPLLDLGTYPIALATTVLGPAVRVQAAGQTAPSGVNGQTSILLSHAGDNQSVLHTTLLSRTPGVATIAGSEGMALIPGYGPGPFTISSHSGRSLEYHEEDIGYLALSYEAAHAARCVQEGLGQSPIRPLTESLITMQVIDEVRRQLGIVFAEDAPAT